MEQEKRKLVEEGKGCVEEGSPVWWVFYQQRADPDMETALWKRPLVRGESRW